MSDRLRPRSMRRVSLIVAGLSVVVLGLLQLLRGQPELTSVTTARPLSFVAQLSRNGGRICQAAVEIPQRTATLEILVGTFGSRGPGVNVTLQNAHSRSVRLGGLRGGWREGPLGIPVTQAGETRAGKLCLSFAAGSRIAVAGERDLATSTSGSSAAAGQISVVARLGQQRSTLQLLPRLAQRFGAGNAAWIGPWTVYTAGALVILGITLGGVAVFATADSTQLPKTNRVPVAGKTLTATGIALGLCWALVTPPFHVPDETAHTSYVQYLSETYRLPSGDPAIAPFSSQERNVMEALEFSRVVGRPLQRVNSTSSQEAALRLADRRLGGPGGGNVETASANPFLYYALEAPIFRATASGGLITQVLAMRALSVLFLAGTVLCVFLFLRECMPSSPWTWTVGGLACAFQPLFGFISSGVNPDSLLFLCASASLLGVAVVLRRGLTVRRAVLLASVAAAGLLTKPLYLALLPMLCAALLLAAWRQSIPWKRPLAIALGLFAALFGIAAFVSETNYGHPYFAVASSVATGGGSGVSAAGTSWAREGSYILQLFLPRLPFLVDQIPGVPLKDIWIDGLVGVFGWVDYGFGDWTNTAGMIAFSGAFMFFVIALWRSRAHFRASWPIAVCGLLALAGIVAVVGVTDYGAFRANGARFEQARYLLPLLPLYGATFGVAAKAFTERNGQILLHAAWVLFSMHTLAAVLLTLNRYYGP